MLFGFLNDVRFFFFACCGCSPSPPSLFYSRICSHFFFCLLAIFFAHVSCTLAYEHSSARLGALLNNILPLCNESKPGTFPPHSTRGRFPGNEIVNNASIWYFLTASSCQLHLLQQLARVGSARCPQFLHLRGHVREENTSVGDDASSVFFFPRLVGDSY